MPGLETAAAEWIRFAEGFLWPLLRIGGVFMAAPVISSPATPARVRIFMAALFAVVLMPLMPPPPGIVLLTPTWFLAIAHELLIGLMLGFTLQLVFDALLYAGELCALSIGLGFAQLTDPIRGGSTQVVSQLFLIMATALFVTTNAHLALIELLHASFVTLPVGGMSFRGTQAMGLVEFGGGLLANGIRLALPVVVALLLVNMAFGVISRASPALNLFALGFPITLLSGILILWLVITALGEQFSTDTATALDFIRQLIGA